MIESDQDFGCPYCGETNSLRIDPTGGTRQFFVTDCEVCCNPIDIEIAIDTDGEAFVTAKRSGEG